jgi:hypothetical protein
MTESEYQLDKLYIKYEGRAPKRVIKRLFTVAWDSNSRLGTAVNHTVSDIEAWIEGYQYAKCRRGYDKKQLSVHERKVERAPKLEAGLEMVGGWAVRVKK